MTRRLITLESNGIAQEPSLVPDRWHLVEVKASSLTTGTVFFRSGWGKNPLFDTSTQMIGSCHGGHSLEIELVGETVFPVEIQLTELHN